MRQPKTMTAAVAHLAGSAALAAVPYHALLAATADQPGVGALEEIVVTAQKRSESAQDVPISITALGADDLRGMGINSTEALGNGTPGLIVNDYGNPVITVFTLRGVQ